MCESCLSLSYLPTVWFIFNKSRDDHLDCCAAVLTINNYIVVCMCFMLIYGLDCGFHVCSVWSLQKKTNLHMYYS